MLERWFAARGRADHYVVTSLDRSYELLHSGVARVRQDRRCRRRLCCACRPPNGSRQGFGVTSDGRATLVCGSHQAERGGACRAIICARQSFGVYLPRYTKMRRHARKIEAVARPLFPRYLFVALDLARDRWRSIQSTFGVVGLVMSGEQPAPLPTDVVESNPRARGWHTATSCSDWLPASASAAGCSFSTAFRRPQRRARAYRGRAARRRSGAAARSSGPRLRRR